MLAGPRTRLLLKHYTKHFLVFMSEGKEEGKAGMALGSGRQLMGAPEAELNDLASH